MNSIIIGSIILSILQSILFWDKKPGISVLIFVIATFAILIYTMYKNDSIKNKKALRFSVPIILLGATYFIFNNLFFKKINGIAIIILFFIMCIYLNKDKIKIPQFFYKILTIIMGTLESIAEVLSYLKKFKINIKYQNNEKIFKILKAILISLPIVAIVIILLMSADSIFADLFSGIFELIGKIKSFAGLTNIAGRITVIIILFLFFAGFLINISSKNTMFTQEDEEQESHGIKIENITINTILTILNIIYLIFSTIQFTSLFSQIGNAEGFNYAEYAREGFFQLMFVSFINFGVLFVANINKKEIEINSKIYKKMMSLLIIVFTIIIIISAFYRMNLYEQEYGYTYLRLFVYFILATEVILTIPIILYILEKNINLLKSSIIIVTTMYVVLNFINIDNLIAKRNIDRYFENSGKRTIDIDYLMENTGTDAVQEMLRLLNAKDKKISRRIKEYLKSGKEEYEDKKKYWQEFNLSKLNAEILLEDL